MILPTKHLDGRRALLGVSAEILSVMPATQSVSALWEDFRRTGSPATFEDFALALALLYSIGAIQFEQGLVARSRR